ncbi:hypothetical protein DFQ27_007137 [Actinomortierella ambigua]|uniref:Uncharacterized protein n=1 Tax=Actinomortierella ambigua TaxID=1343610 RepID=A0A9P6UBP9_9FUNG|nr:hypothetical protein DFQ27_007137 [Actinomortierella ambigua]
MTTACTHKSPTCLQRHSNRNSFHNCVAYHPNTEKQSISHLQYQFDQQLMFQDHHYRPLDSSMNNKTMQQPHRPSFEPSPQPVRKQQQQHLPSPPMSPTRPCPPPAVPGLSLNTSEECLQRVTVMSTGDKKYLKLFSPNLVESPVSFLTQKQLNEDKKLWEKGPDEVLRLQIENEHRDAHRARSKQQLYGFAMGLWLGSLMGVLILQQTSAKVYFWSSLARQDILSSHSSLIMVLVLLSCLIIVRSGTRCMMTAIGTCAAVLTCFATLIVNQSRYYPDGGPQRRHLSASTF